MGAQYAGPANSLTCIPRFFAKDTIQPNQPRIICVIFVCQPGFQSLCVFWPMSHAGHVADVTGHANIMSLHLKQVLFSSRMVGPKRHLAGSPMHCHRSPVAGASGTVRSQLQRLTATDGHCRSDRFVKNKGQRK